MAVKSNIPVRVMLGMALLTPITEGWPKGPWPEGMCIALEMDCNSLLISFCKWLPVLCDNFLTFSLCVHTEARHMPPLSGTP